eukprot:Em0008g1022a
MATFLCLSILAACSLTQVLAQTCTNMTLMGLYAWQGTVMTQVQGTWMPVCGGSLDVAGATTACASLGYPGVLDVGFTGPGVAASPCRTSLCGNAISNSTTSATVVCKVANTTGVALRLVGGAVPWEGTVQVTVNGINGTVSSPISADPAALANITMAICRGQGYSGVLRYYTSSASALYGTLTGFQWIDTPVCTSNQNSIFNCSRKSLGPYLSQYGHIADLAVECIGPNSLTVLPVPIRLAGSSDFYRGRVELYYNGHWGTVCSDNWMLPSSHVVCRQMGLGPALGFQGSGNGLGTTWLNSVTCSGLEQDLASCPSTYSFSSSLTCSHSKDVVVNCSVLSTAAGLTVRLNGSTTGAGRVEVFYGGVWGTVCTNGWTPLDATVVCKQLGYDSAIATVTTSFGPGDGMIWMENVRCNGIESKLSDCPFNGWGVSSCSHFQDVGVTCNTVNTPEGKIRLVDGSSPLQGKAQVFHNGSWGQICSIGFDLREANVVCRQLGYVRAQAVQFAVYLQDRIQWMHVDCIGSEFSLSLCLGSSWDNSCNSNQDMTILCSSSPELPVMLVGGTSDDRGRVQAFYNNTWGTVCSELWSDADARVVCRMLGFSTAAVTSTKVTSQYGSINLLAPIWLSNVGCLGTEASINNCQQTLPIGLHTCVAGHIQDAGVSCQESGNSLRLVGGSVPSEGRLEVYYNGQWGTVCSSFFTMIEGYVACRQLGYTDVLNVLTGPSYATNQSIWLSSLNCNGLESSLLQCVQSFGTNGCTSLQNTWLVCGADVPTEGAIKLSGADSPSAGRVNVFHNGKWGRVCQHGWGLADAQVVCRQLKFQGAIQAMNSSSSPFSSGYLPTLSMDNVDCNGTEQMLIACKNVTTSGNCDDDAAVVCNDTTNPSEWDVRLVKGAYPYVGVVQVGHLGVWCTVYDQLSTREAQVACRQLNYEGGIPVPYIDYNAVVVVYWLTGVKCVGNESRLEQCNHSDWTRMTSKGIYGLVAIQCSVPSTLPSTQSTGAQTTVSTGTSLSTQGSSTGTPPSVQTPSTNGVSTPFNANSAITATTVAVPLVFVGFFGTIAIIVIITAACK